MIADLRGAYTALTSGTVPAVNDVTRQSPFSARKRRPAAHVAGIIGVLALVAAAVLFHFAPWKKSGPGSAAATATPAPVAVKAGPAKFDPAREAAYVGTWSGGKGNRAYIMKGDHTALKTEEDGQPVNGRWSVVNGEFQVNWGQGRSFSGRLAEDGQRIIGEGKVDWFRKKP